MTARAHEMSMLTLSTLSIYEVQSTISDHITVLACHLGIQEEAKPIRLWNFVEKSRASTRKVREITAGKVRHITAFPCTVVVESSRLVIFRVWSYPNGFSRYGPWLHRPDGGQGYFVPTWLCASLLWELFDPISWYMTKDCQMISELRRDSCANFNLS